VIQACALQLFFWQFYDEVSDTTHIEAICQGFALIHELWSVPIELGTCLWLLQRQLGLAFLAPGAVAILATSGILGLAHYIRNAQKIWIQGIQTRVDATASMLGSMKVISSTLISKLANYCRQGG
jgi:ATP-binding cassette, subfamily C (CFTR/MRP), member 1